jgi:methylated-DNA-[protein]-cysteine S-methyltransferase
VEAVTRYALFDTAIGACGIAWGDRGVVGLWLPDTDRAGLRRRIARRLPHAREAAPEAEIRAAIDSIVDLFAGGRPDLSGVRLDVEGVPEFDRRVYEAAREVAPGQTVTYGELAARLGDRTAAREVGGALSRNPFPIVVPCHRVLAAGGRNGGFSAPGGVATKLRILQIEGASAPGIPTLFPESRLNRRDS